MSLDPILTQALWQRVISIVDEAAAGLVRTSFSQVVRDFNDFACGIFDVEGNMLAHSTRTTTLFIGVMPQVMKTFLRHHPADSFKPGDALVTNDPWLGAGHTYDFCVASPIFDQDRLVGFSICIVHHLDVGGRMGTTEAKDVFEEGIRLPIIKLFENGAISPMAESIIATNVRAPDKLFGDLRAQIVANNVCSRGVVQMLHDYALAPEQLLELSRDIQDRSERSLRARISELPDGEFSHSITLPPVGDVSGIRLAVKVRIEGDQVYVDYHGSSGEVAAAVNVPLNMTISYSVYAIKLALDNVGVPNNEGSLRPIRVSAPTGSLLNCLPPAPTWGRTMIAHQLPELIFGALEKLVPERTMAACGSTPLTTTRFGVRTPTGGFRVGMNSGMGGMGATSRTDGPSCRGFPYNVSNIPIEMMETDLPILYLCKEFLVDSGGPGQFRGGLGQSFAIQAVQEDGPLSLGVRGAARKEDSVHPVIGRLGGGSGRGESLTLNGKAIPYGPQQTMHKGDIIAMSLPGGGGYGNPFERSVARVMTDFSLGYVSAAAAMADYGVVINEVGELDAHATEKLRGESVSTERH